MTSNRIALVGTGFVADLYMRSLRSFPSIEVVGAYDNNPRNLRRFCEYWGVSEAASLQQLLGDTFSPTLILNLTNPSSHFEISKACLNRGKHVYSEKPLALDFDQARELCDIATSRALLLASAPCSVLGESAQTLGYALRSNLIGRPYLAYAELDDDLITQAPYSKWRSESGAPWPYEDEFGVGCTLEHAGYYLSWLIAIFGSVTQVISASSRLISDKPVDSRVPAAPDFSCATLSFTSGMVARMTCSIIAPHNHQIRVFGEEGILEVDRSWDNSSPVKLRRRFVVRRKLMNSPFARRIGLKKETHPKISRWGAAAMNFALGPAEMLSAINEARPCRLSSEFALHMTEVVLAIQRGGGAHLIETRCLPMEPMPWAL